MKLFNHILEGHEATAGNAYDHARGFDWSQVETTEQDKPEHSQYVDSLNGVGIYYCYGTDTYFFEDETEEETKPFYVDFLNKEKNFTPDKKEFDSYEEAKIWCAKTMDKFDPDCINRA